jgi:hypothetical protein
MKKLICILLCVILLTGCGSKPVEEIPSYFKRELDPELIEGLNPEFVKRLERLEFAEPRTEIINRYYPQLIRELNPRDYGRLYPFPALGHGSVWGFEGVLGLMTEDGRIVVDGVYEFVEFIDVDDGYYRVAVMFPDENSEWGSIREIFLISANGSRVLKVSETAEPIGNGFIRVNERRGASEMYTGYDYISVIDFHGKVEVPFYRAVEKYANFIADEWGWSQLYVDLQTKEALFSNGWLVRTFPGVIERVSEESVTGRYRFTPAMGTSPMNIPGITMEISDNLLAYVEDEKVIITDIDGTVLRIANSFDFFISGDNIFIDGTPHDFDLNERIIGEREVQESPYDWAHPIHGSDLRKVGVNGFMGVVDSDDNWIIKIDTLKNFD